jgi:uncharacterized membrane protein
MQARILVPLLLLLAAGCARPTDAPPPAAAAPEAASTPAAQTEAAARAPVEAGATAPDTTAASNAGDDTMQGIRAGEPAPGTPREPQPAETVAAWHAFGNEPFWSVDARGGELVFRTPEDQAGVALSGRRVPSLVGTVILGTGPRGEFHLGITPGKCSDGMSDRSYDHASTFIYGGATYRGCAEPR